MIARMCAAGGIDATDGRHVVPEDGRRVGQRERPRLADLLPLDGVGLLQDVDDRGVPVPVLERSLDEPADVVPRRAGQLVELLVDRVRVGEEHLEEQLVDDLGLALEVQVERRPAGAGRPRDVLDRRARVPRRAEDLAARRRSAAAA